MHRKRSIPICLQHPTYLLLIHVFVQARVQMLPPLEQQGMADEFEPRSKFEGGIIEHRL
jgi:hypothetical protein